MVQGDEPMTHPEISTFAVEIPPIRATGCVNLVRDDNGRLTVTSTPLK
jgi:hypothetical protein